MIKTRLVRLLAHAKKYIVFNVVWQWISLLAQVGIVFAIVRLLGILYHGKNPLTESGLLIALFAAMAVRFLCDTMSVRTSYKASADVKAILRDNIYAKLLRLGNGYQDKMATSEIVQLATEGVEQLETYFGKYLPQLFYSLLAPITLFIILSCTASVKAGAVLLACVPLIPISIVAVQKIAGRLLQKYWGSYTQLGDSFLENLQGLTTLKIYQADARKAEEMDREADTFRKITMKVLTMQLNSTSVMDIVAYGGAAVGMGVAVTEFVRGVIGFEQTLCIILLASEFFIPLRLLGSFFHIAMNGMAASDKIFAFLDLDEDDVTDGDEWAGAELTMRDVSFGYQEDREILHQVSLDVKEGSFVCLVGASGSGKSTIASLLAGRYKQYQGLFTIGGVPAERLSRTEFIRHVTVVKHNSYLFKGTVWDNLIVADKSATDADMIRVLKQVNLWDFLEREQGLQTVLSDRGENLSGGQCQRLALARALLRDSDMYIFDEATSNIDAESEEMIMEVIRDLAKTKTVILISHRLFNVITADCIYMLQQGSIVEQGTHEELMTEKGAYYTLFESQRRLEQYGEEAIGIG